MPADKDARDKLKLCQKQITSEKFAKVIGRPAACSVSAAPGVDHGRKGKRLCR